MQKQSILDYIGTIIGDFKYKYGIVTGHTKGIVTTISSPITIEYSTEGIVKRYKEGDYLDIRANESIDIIIPDEDNLKSFERDLYSIIPDNQINVALHTVEECDSLFSRVNSMKKINVNKETHLMVINSKDGLAAKNSKYVPELSTYADLDDAKVLLEMRLDLLREVTRLNNRELKYMVIVHIKYPILSLKMFNMHERKVLCGAIQYRRYLHWNEYDKMVTALYYDIPVTLTTLLESYAIHMADRGLIL